MTNFFHRQSQPAGVAVLVQARTLGLAAILVGLSACGGHDQDGGAREPVGPTGQSALVPGGEGDAVAYVKDAVERRLAMNTSIEGGGNTSAQPVTAPAPANDSSNAATPVTPVSGTPLQEAGVDEDDVLKVDGTRFYSLQSTATYTPGRPWARLQLHERHPQGQPQALSVLDLPAAADATGVARGMYVLPGSGRAAVLSERTGGYGSGAGCQANVTCAAMAPSGDPVSPAVWVDVLDAYAPTTPQWTQRLRLEGSLVDSRRMGNALVVVTQHQPPVVDQLWRLDAEARSQRLTQLGAAEVLPTYTMNDGPSQPLVSEADCHLQRGNASTQVAITTISVIDLSSNHPQPRSHCILGGTEALYMSPSNLYLATTRWAYEGRGYVANTTIDVHKFSISLEATGYRGSAELPGHLGWNAEMKPYRFSEHRGDLRVLTFTGQEGWAMPMPMEAGNTIAATPPSSPATLHILRENATTQRLETIGQLPNSRRPAALGKPGEQVYGVRLMGDRGYVVTFRRTDPLYVLDLSDPTDPKALSALEAAGFSNYLFPLNDGLLLGVGKDADAMGRVGGVKVAIFDVRDGGHPRELAVRIFGQPGSTSGLDVNRHGIDLATRGDTVRVALPLSLFGRGHTLQAAGLQRLEVNTRAGTLTDRGWIDSPAGARYDLASERSVQIDDRVFYLSGGLLGAWDW